jgi:integrase
MNEGAVFKRCGCKQTVTEPDGTTRRKPLGEKCPKLRRKDGTGWNPRHGTWGFQLQVPGTRGPDRAHLRQQGHASSEDAKNALGRVVDLLELAEAAEDPQTTRTAIADLIRPALKTRSKLPDPDEIRRAIGLGRPVDDDLTVGQFLGDWVETRKDLSRNAKRSYTQQIRTQLEPRLGNHVLARLRVAHVQKAFDDMEADAALIADQNAQRHAVIAESKAAWREHRSEDARRARALLKELPPLRPVQGPATIARYHACLRAALTDAVKQKLIDDNVAKHVYLTGVRRAKPKLWTAEREARWRETGVVPFPVMVWTAEHTKKFLATVKDEACGYPSWFYTAFALIAHTGLRRGEACGLAWENIDFTTGQIEITQQLVQYGWEADIQDGAKSADGARTVIAPKPVQKALARHRKTQAEWKQAAGQAWAAGEEWAKHGLAFTTETGYPIHPAQLNDTLHAITKQADLPPIRLHDLRHGAATLARAAGIDLKTISAILGHSSYAFTADTYGDVVNELKKDAADKIADQLALEDEEGDDGDDDYLTPTLTR